MEKTMNVAKALDRMYFAKKGEHLDQMKMHKLMYFSQRESLMLNNEPLFDDKFYAWKYGPVLKTVRNEFKKQHPFEKYTDDVSEETKKVLKGVVDRYAEVGAWELSALSHSEYSWKKARNGLQPTDNGDNALSLEAIRVDAATEKARRVRVSTV